MLWWSLRYLKSILRLSFDCVEHGIPSVYLVGLAALPHLQHVVDLGHCVQFSFLHLCLEFQVVFSFHVIQCCAIAHQYSPSKLSYYDFSLQRLARGFKLSPAKNVSPKGKTGLDSNTMWYNREYVMWHIGKIGGLGVPFLMLAPSVGDIW